VGKKEKGGGKHMGPLLKFECGRGERKGSPQLVRASSKKKKKKKTTPPKNTRVRGEGGGCESPPRPKKKGGKKCQ